MENASAMTQCATDYHLDPFGFVLLYDCLLIYNVKTRQRSYYNESNTCMHVCYLSPSR